MKGAAGYYESLATLLVKKQATLDIWAYGVDQFGLMEMKSMVVSTGGLLAMHEEFNYFIFKQSFPNFYQADPQGRFQFPIACKLTLRVSKDIRINGMLGPGKSLQDNTLKTAADM